MLQCSIYKVILYQTVNLFLDAESIKHKNVLITRSLLWPNWLYKFDCLNWWIGSLIIWVVNKIRSLIFHFHVGCGTLTAQLILLLYLLLFCYIIISSRVSWNIKYFDMTEVDNIDIESKRVKFCDYSTSFSHGIQHFYLYKYPYSH